VWRDRAYAKQLSQEEGSTSNKGSSEGRMFPVRAVGILHKGLPKRMKIGQADRPAEKAGEVR